MVFALTIFLDYSTQFHRLFANWTLCFCPMLVMGFVYRSLILFEIDHLYFFKYI